MRIVIAAAILSILNVMVMANTSDAFAMGSHHPLAFSQENVRTSLPTKYANDRIRSQYIHRGGGGVRNRTRGLDKRMKDFSLSSTSTTSTDGSDEKNKSTTDEQTISAAAFNLIKGCVGSGVLSLPAGVAAIGDVPNA